MNIEAVVFDLDGTLIQSEEDLADAINWVLKQCGYPEHPTEAYRYFLGDGLKQAIVRALPEIAREEPIISNCVDLSGQEYIKRCFVKTKPYEGIENLLKQLQGTKLKLGILTNKPHETTKKIVEQKLGFCNFHAVQGVVHHDMRKPKIAFSQKVLQQLDIRPDKTLFVGDTNTDMITAAAANMIGVGVTWGFRTREELISNGAQFVIDHPLDLLQIIEK